MANTQKKMTKKTTNNEKYLQMIFSMLKKRENLVLSDKKTHFNDTEIRLLSEVLSAKYDGRRLISTQLANLLGVTRSAVSQIVNRLEEQGVVERVADSMDKKIAYIEITDSAMAAYGEDLDFCLDFVGRVVEKFGEDNFKTMYTLFDDFMALVENERWDYGEKISRKR